MVILGTHRPPDPGPSSCSSPATRSQRARIGIAADLTIVATQALAALWFFELFRRVDSFAAGSLAAFGFMNSVAILVATAFSATALEVTLDGGFASGAGATPLLLYQLHDAAWAVRALFFGLWLVPMGWLVVRSGFMPRLLGRILVVGEPGTCSTPTSVTCSPTPRTWPRCSRSPRRWASSG